jgi:hypothetical protein
MKQLFQKIKDGFARAPHRFVGRQIYKALVIVPYTIFFVVISKLFKNKSAETPSAGSVCFIVTSLIYCKQKKLTYASTRSVFNAEERYRQTLKTIASIRHHAPGARIVLLEAGLQNNPFDIAKEVDDFCYIGGDTLVRLACDSRFKSLGEVMMMLRSSKKIPSAERYFKISGRYFLNDDFILADWLKGEIVYHFIRPDFISTRLYSFSASMKSIIWSAFGRGFPYLFLDYPVEYILAAFTPKKYITTITTVGISGADATSGTAVKE